MDRRRTLTRALGLAAALALVTSATGCGFRLRGSQRLPFQRLRLVAAAGAPVASELRQALQANGVQIAAPDTMAPRPAGAAGDAAPQEPPAVDAVLEVLTDQRERAVVGITSAGQVRELQLRIRFTFRLRTPQGADLIPDTELLLERDLSFTETAVLGKEAEEALIFQRMQSDAVQQVLRRLATVGRAPG
jgi:LPS-assembly lipoprotein